jgi:hypothetical protein
MKLYPVTIFTTRYGGVYEGASWGAAPCDYDALSFLATGDDLEALDWWCEYSYIVGKGNHPDVALQDLFVKLKDLVNQHGVKGAHSILKDRFGKFTTVSERTLSEL